MGVFYLICQIGPARKKQWWVSIFYTCELYDDILDELSIFYHHLPLGRYSILMYTCGQKLKKKKTPSITWICFFNINLKMCVCVCVCVCFFFNYIDY